MDELVITALNNYKQPRTVVLTDGNYEIKKEEYGWIIKKLESETLLYDKIDEKIEIENNEMEIEEYQEVENRKAYNFTLRPKVYKSAFECAKKNNIALSRLIENLLLQYVKENEV